MLSRVYTHLYINGLYIILYINLKHLAYKQLRLYINLYIKKQHLFLLRNDDLYFIYIFQIKSSLKSISQEFLLFLKLLKKHSIQYFTIELWIIN